MASYFVHTKVRCLHDGVTNNLRSRVAFLRQSEASGIVRIVFVRWNTPDGTDDFTRYMRWKHDGTRWPYNGHAKEKMTTRMHHEGEHSCSLPAFFWHAKDFVITHEVAPEAQKPYKRAIRLLKMASRMCRCFYDQSRIWKKSNSCGHLLSNSGQCDARKNSM